MKRYFLLCSIQLASLFVIPRLVLGQDATIRGLVKEKFVGALSFASVTLYDSIGHAVRKVMSDNRGIYVITVPIGNYHLIVAKPGYIAEEKPLILNKSKGIETILRRYQREVVDRKRGKYIIN